MSVALSVRIKGPKGVPIAPDDIVYTVNTSGWPLRRAACVFCSVSKKCCTGLQKCNIWFDANWIVAGAGRDDSVCRRPQKTELAKTNNKLSKINNFTK